MIFFIKDHLKEKKLKLDLDIEEDLLEPISSLRIAKNTNLLSYVSREDRTILKAIDKRLDQLELLDKKITKIEEKLNREGSRKNVKKSSEKKYLEDDQKNIYHHKKNSSTLMEYLQKKKMSREISRKILEEEILLKKVLKAQVEKIKTRRKRLKQMIVNYSF